MRYPIKLTVLLILLVSCSDQTAPTDLVAPQPKTAGTGSLVQSATETVSRIIPTSTIGEIIQPTPTPILYNVVLNDSLIGIALKFNITLESLMAANPGIGNQPLIVGQVLTIPSPEAETTIATSTPVPAQISQVNCFLNKDDSLQCLVLIDNEYGDWIQNLSVQISLVDKDGRVIESSAAYSPLDLLAPGKSTVVSSLFQTAPSGEYQAHASLLSAATLSSPNDSYPLITLHNTLIEVNWDGSSAQIRGEAFLDSEGNEAKRVWILAIAYDKDDSVIGFRRWESNEILVHGDVLPFEFMISSLGSSIDHVELTVEAIR